MCSYYCLTEYWRRIATSSTLPTCTENHMKLPSLTLCCHETSVLSKPTHMLAVPTSIQIILLVGFQFVREHYRLTVAGFHFWVEVRVSTAPVQEHVPCGQNATNAVGSTGAYQKNGEYVPNLGTVEVSVMVRSLHILTYTCRIKHMCRLARHAHQEYEMQECKHTGTETSHCCHHCKAYTHYLQQHIHVITCHIKTMWDICDTFELKANAAKSIWTAAWMQWKWFFLIVYFLWF